MPGHSVFPHRGAHSGNVTKVPASQIGTPGGKCQKPQTPHSDEINWILGM